MTTKERIRHYERLTGMTETELKDHTAATVARMTRVREAVEAGKTRAEVIAVTR